ncbi:hypothetical protein [Actinoplanes sp. NPDC051411]|uniref:hypothetical protein n=1 Tax=Actinoplanes sp. NPDC051411 TaxID=3155522 RepID=UPI0034272FAF
MALNDSRVAQLVVQRGQPSSSITFAPPGSPPWTLIEAQLFGTSGDGGAFEALCTSYSYVVGGQGHTALDANVSCQWVEGLTVATFTLSVYGGGWAEAGVKLTTFE